MRSVALGSGAGPYPTHCLPDHVADGFSGFDGIGGGEAENFGVELAYAIRRGGVEAT